MSGTSNFLDTIAHPTVVNPAAAYQQGAQAANALWQARDWQAKQAAGQAQQSGIDASGQYQPNAAMTALKNAGPGAALAAGQTLESSQRLGTAQTAQGIAVNGLIASAVAPLIDPTLTPDPMFHQALSDTAQRLIAQGVPAAQVIGGLSKLSNDPTAARQQLEVMRQGMLPPDQQQQNIYGAKGTQTGPGGSTIGTSQNVRSGAVSAPPQQGAPQGPSPDNLATQLPVIDQNRLMPDGKTPNPNYGQPMRDNLGNILRQQGSPLVQPTPGNTPAQPPGAVTSQPLPPPAGVRPSPQNPPRLPGAVPTSAAQPPTQQPTPTGLPLGTSESIAADVGKFKQDQFAIPQGQQSVQSLQKAQLALEASNTGRTSEGVHNMLATLNTFGVSTQGMADNVSSYDLAHKYLMDYARKSGAAAHSDLQLQTSEGANASTGISNQAALDVVHTNIGRERQAIAQNMEAPQTGIGYGEHSGKFATNTDPRGFAIDAYKPADLQKMVAGMTATEKAKFYKSAGIAQRLGLLNPAGGGGA
jgi:hypothetical protein